MDMNAPLVVYPSGPGSAPPLPLSVTESSSVEDVIAWIHDRRLAVDRLTPLIHHHCIDGRALLSMNLEGESEDVKQMGLLELPLGVRKAFIYEVQKCKHQARTTPVMMMSTPTPSFTPSSSSTTPSSSIPPSSFTSHTSYTSHSQMPLHHHDHDIDRDVIQPTRKMSSAPTSLRVVAIITLIISIITTIFHIIFVATDGATKFNNQFSLGPFRACLDTSCSSLEDGDIKYITQSNVDAFRAVRAFSILSVLLSSSLAILMGVGIAFRWTNYHWLFVTLMSILGCNWIFDLIVFAIWAGKKGFVAAGTPTYGYSFILLILAFCFEFLFFTFLIIRPFLYKCKTSSSALNNRNSLQSSNDNYNNPRTQFAYISRLNLCIIFIISLIITAIHIVVLATDGVSSYSVLIPSMSADFHLSLGPFRVCAQTPDDNGCTKITDSDVKDNFGAKADAFRAARAFAVIATIMSGGLSTLSGLSAGFYWTNRFWIFCCISFMMIFSWLSELIVFSIWIFENGFSVSENAFGGTPIEISSITYKYGFALLVTSCGIQIIYSFIVLCSYCVRRGPQYKRIEAHITITE